MKKILFRLKKDEIVVGYERWDAHNGKWNYTNIAGAWEPEPIEHNTKELYTGLKDIHMKGIFENDIIISTLHPMPVPKRVLFRGGCFILANGRSAPFSPNKVINAYKIFHEKLMKIGQ